VTYLPKRKYCESLGYRREIYVVYRQNGILQYVGNFNSFEIEDHILFIDGESIV